MKQLIFIIAVITLFSEAAYSQRDSTLTRFRATELIAPLSLVALGSAAFIFPGARSVDRSIRDEVVQHNFRGTKVDNYTQFLPMAAVYGLNLCGVKGKSSYRDLTVMMATATAMNLAATYALKYSTGVLRPDNSARNSFPSGHTAIAFMGAEFLRKEYKHLSPWYGVGGYVVAGLTGTMRIYNNRHWLTDVLAGAGIGILSAKAAYWLYPAMQRWLFPGRVGRRKSTDAQTFTMPFYDGQTVGLSFALSF